jgi:hypothetical protein
VLRFQPRQVPVNAQPTVNGAAGFVSRLRFNQLHMVGLGRRLLGHGWVLHSRESVVGYPLDRLALAMTSQLEFLRRRQARWYFSKVVAFRETGCPEFLFLQRATGARFLCAEHCAATSRGLVPAIALMEAAE